MGDHGSSKNASGANESSAESSATTDDSLARPIRPGDTGYCTQIGVTPGGGVGCLSHSSGRGPWPDSFLGSILLPEGRPLADTIPRSVLRGRLSPFSPDCQAPGPWPVDERSFRAI